MQESERPLVVITRAVPPSAVERLCDVAEVRVSPHDRPLKADELAELVSGATAIVSMLTDRIDEAVLDAAGATLRLVANAAVGVDNVDRGACTRRGVVVTNTPGVLDDATADLAIGLLLALTRRVIEGDQLIRRRTPWSWDMSFMLGQGLQGKTFGVVGMGRIGQAAALRARAFGMKIAYHSRRRDSAGPGWMPLDQLFQESDALSLHCPLTPETHHLVDEHALSLMKPTAVLINTARGPIVDESALVNALVEGVIAGAALDVFEDEPVPHEGLLELPCVVLTPHLGSATIETRAAMAALAAENVVSLLKGMGLITPVVEL